MSYCGQIYCDTLGLPEDFFYQVEPNSKLISSSDYRLPPRLRSSHKGLFGHVLVMGGDFGMSGAVLMSALGAARTGAGLVTIATRKEHAPLMMTKQPEIMALGIEKEDDLLPLIKRATVIVVGPGLGRSNWAKMLMSVSIASGLPIIIDADALTLLSQMSLKVTQAVLTPHSGEAARLLNTTAFDIQKDRLAAIKKIQNKYGGVIVLKGAGTIVLDESEKIGICAAGNPGMASGGMGDILSGVIAGLIAQGLSLSDAANLGVCLHAEAGDEAAKAGERGMLATDLLPFIREKVNFL